MLQIMNTTRQHITISKPYKQHQRVSLLSHSSLTLSGIDRCDTSPLWFLTHLRSRSHSMAATWCTLRIPHQSAHASSFCILLNIAQSTVVAIIVSIFALHSSSCGVDRRKISSAQIRDRDRIVDTRPTRDQHVV